MVSVKAKYFSAVAIFCFIIVSMSCKKYLDAKTDERLVVPNTIENLQALLDFYEKINLQDPTAGETSSDDYYLPYTTWQGINEYEKRTYTWGVGNLFPIGGNNDWSFSYDKIYRANTVLTNIDKIERTVGNQNDLNDLKGQALIIRAKSFFQIATVWALAYDSSTAAGDLGIPLRLDVDFNKPSVRSSVQQTYDQIIQDLKNAVTLLPVAPSHVVRPSKASALAYLARTYLSMRNYDSCLKYANECFQLSHNLLDYNKVATNEPFSFQNFSPEVIWHTAMGNEALSYTKARTDSILYDSYDNNDLRKKIYFEKNEDGTHYFKGSYAQYLLFTGIATDEIYLMRAEAYAHIGKVAAAMNDLNTLLVKRWKTGTFIPHTTTNANEALKIILIERRKELLMRGLRWMDIKRLNKEGANISLKRLLDNQTSILLPNDPKFALAIPEDVIAISGMQQNPR